MMDNFEGIAQVLARSRLEGTPVMQPGHKELVNFLSTSPGRQATRGVIDTIIQRSQSMPMQPGQANQELIAQLKAMIVNGGLNV
jgi:hypothetical protein